ncbi:MAG: 2-hydroxyacid dehydrogenase [Actinomycetota bacterium]|nr:2-hydroxyacid dehydrogenase [Actinomycetota bacterium]
MSGDVTLVWLPFAPDELGDLPEQLDVVRYAAGEPPDTDTVGDVRFFVPAYDMELPLSDLLPRMPRLEVLQTLTAGVDNVLPLLPPGVLLCNARGVHDASTAELAATLLLATLRGLPDFVRAQQDGHWRHETRRALADHRVLIVGYGSIGAALERRLAPFECEIVRVAHSARPGVHPWDALPGLLPQADAVVLLVPLTDETRQMVDRSFLAAMPDSAVLVNVSRGAVVDTDALLAECRSGRLLAALDVTDPEPLPREHPLWHTDGVLITPHVGGATTAMKPRAYELVAAQLHRWARGEPLVNVVRGR